MGSISRAPTIESQAASKMRKGQDTRFLDVFYHRAVPSDPVVDILNSMSDQWTGRRLKRRFLDWADHLHVSQAWFEVWIFGEDTRPTKVEDQLQRYTFEKKVPFHDIALSLLDFLSVMREPRLRLIASVSHECLRVSGSPPWWMALLSWFFVLSPYEDSEVAFDKTTRAIISHSFELPPADYTSLPMPRFTLRSEPMRVPSQCGAKETLNTLDVTRESVGFAWLSHAPRFKSDFNIYIFEPHKRIPKHRLASVRLNLSGAPKAGDFMIIFSHIASLQLFTKTRSDLYLNAKRPASATQIWTCQAEVVLSLIALVRVVILETTDFLNELGVKLTAMKILSRRKPSTSKIRYLAHLQDCREAACAGLEQVLQTCENVRLWIDSHQDRQTWWDGGQAFDDRLDTLKEDLNFLRRAIQAKESEWDELRQHLHEHVNLVQNRRIFLTTIVAGLYIPLSFTTSLFGMNMVPMSVKSQNNVAEAIAEDIATLPVEYKNSTMAIISALNSAGNLNYQWRTFAITAASLMMTLPIGILFDSLVRRSVRWGPFIVLLTVALLPLLITIVYALTTAATAPK